MGAQLSHGLQGGEEAGRRKRWFACWVVGPRGAHALFGRAGPGILEAVRPTCARATAGCAQPHCWMASLSACTVALAKADTSQEDRQVEAS